MPRSSHGGPAAPRSASNHSSPRVERAAQRPLPPAGDRLKIKPGALYGLHAVAAAWRNPERRIRALYATDSGLESFATILRETADLKRPSPQVVDKSALDRALPEAVHQGLVLDVEPLPERDESDLVRMAEGLERAVVVVLDQVTDPHNIGAILRSAAAFGALALVVTERHTPEVTGTLAKTASGALEVVPIIRVVNLARALSVIQEAGFWCVGLAESGERRLDQLNLNGRLALVLGAEGPGLRRLTKERCDELVRLPTRAPIGAINVSNAAAVALYETVRGRDD